MGFQIRDAEKWNLNWGMRLYLLGGVSHLIGSLPTNEEFFFLLFLLVVVLMLLS